MYIFVEILQILMLICALREFFKGAFGEPGVPESLYIKSTFDKYGRNYGQQAAANYGQLVAANL